MVRINPHIFRATDIRGRIDTDLGPEVAKRIGRAFAEMVHNECKDGSPKAARLWRVAVAWDNRLSSRELADHFIEGLRRGGCDVMRVGMAPTPVLYFATHYANCDAGAAVTASHLGPEYNGFKLCVKGRTLYGEELRELGLLAGRDLPELNLGSVQDYEGLIGDYMENIRRQIKLQRRLKVVVDAGNGVTCLLAPALLESIGCEVVRLFCELDGSFPNHIPDPQVASNLLKLSELVVETKADIGIAYDGDGDRVGVVDDQGKHVLADRVLVVLARELLKLHPGAKVVFDVLSSQVLADEIARAGGQPIRWKSGHAFIESRMREEGAPLGGEMSGHIFFADRYFGYDDGIYASCRILEVLSRYKEPLSQIMKTIPTLASTPEYRPRCPDSIKFKVVEEVKERLSARYQVWGADGVRVTFPRGWGLLRASNTEPKLSLRFEAETEEDLLAYKKILQEELARFPEVEPF